MEKNNNQSEVSRLLQQIEREYQGAQTALNAYAVTAPHAFITVRLEQIGRMHEHLQQIVGEGAIRLIAERLEALPETHHNGKAEAAT